MESTNDFHTSNSILLEFYIFFFSSRRRHTIFDCDWSSDVCSSDLPADDHGAVGVAYLFGDHTNRIGPLQAQSPREEVWPVIQSLRCFNNAVLRVFREDRKSVV